MTKIQFDRYLVDNRHGAALTQPRQHFFRLIRAHIVVGQNALYVFHALPHDLCIIGTAVLPQQKLQDIGGDICPLFDLFSQILAHNLSVEMLPQLLFEHFPADGACL